VRVSACADPGFPTLVSGWILYCSGSGDVDRARRVESGELRALTVVTARPVVAPGDDGTLRIGALGPGARWEWLEAGASRVEPAPELLSASRPSAVVAWGATVALAFDDRVEVAWEGGGTRIHADARPLPGEMVVGRDFVAWTERNASGDDTLVLWRRGEKPHTLPLDGRISRLPASDGDHVAVVVDGQVTVIAPATGQRVVHPADSGFLHAPALAAETACWEDRAALRAGGDVGIRCSNGWSFDEKDDETHPSMWGSFLAFRRGDRLWLARLPGPS
jgi:hypothetical protein